MKIKDSVLFKYLLNSEFLSIDASEYTSNFTEDIKKQKEKLKAILDETQYKEAMKLKDYTISHMFHIRDIECFKMLYLGIKLGIEVGEFCAEEFREE